MRTKSYENWCRCKRQRNLSVNLLRKTKKKPNYLNEKKISDKRTFQKEIKPFFSDKGSMSKKLMLDEKDKIVRKDKNVAEIMTNYFINTIKTLDIKSSKNSNNNDIMEMISQFKGYPR